MGELDELIEEFRWRASLEKELANHALANDSYATAELYECNMNKYNRVATLLKELKEYRCKEDDAINKKEQAKVSPLSYKIGDVVKLGGTDYEIWDISSEPYEKFDDGSWHYVLTLHRVGGSKFEIMFVNDAQIRPEEDDDGEED